MNYWDTVAELFGQNVADVVQGVLWTLYGVAILIGVIITAYKIVTTAMVNMKSNDYENKKKAWGDAFKSLASSWIALIACAVIIPLLWQFVVPLLISLGA